MKKIFRKIQSLFPGFRAKLLAAFFLCVFLPLCIIEVSLYRVTYRIASEKIMNSVILSDDQLNVQINNRLQQTENTADSIQYNIYTLFSAQDDPDRYRSVFNEVRNSIYLYKTTFGFYHIYSFLPDTQLGAFEGLYFLSLKDFSMFDLSETQLKTPGTSSIWSYQKDIRLPFVLSDKETGSDVITCCRLLKNQTTKEPEYAYAILLNPGEFSDLLSETFQDDRITSYLISEDGTIMAHTSRELCGSVLSEEKRSLLLNRTESIFTQDRMHYHTIQLDNGWYHITEVPDSYISANTLELLRTMITAIAIILILVVIMIFLFTGNLSRRIKRLSDAMENFRIGNDSDVQIQETAPLLPEDKEPELYDEIDKLGLAFTNMQTTLRENMESILELSLSEEKLKYQLLQSQINPHFLYNILGTIKTCQSIGRLDIAGQMITDLTQFYRLSLRKSGDRILIRDELEIARLYLNMEKLCHNETLSWEIHAEDGIENFLICRFTLQPFLENCILHGYSRTTPTIHIIVDVIYGDDDVIITICDNGIGIESEQLEELKNTLKNKTVDYEKHFGIGNVNKRISSPSFGNGTVEIDSIPGKGTQITITFAQMEE